MIYLFQLKMKRITVYYETATVVETLSITYVNIKNLDYSNFESLSDSDKFSSSSKISVSNIDNHFIVYYMYFCIYYLDNKMICKIIPEKDVAKKFDYFFMNSD